MRLAVIIHRYGAALGGGAERLAHGFATAAAARGWSVEAWTTCADDHYTWANSRPAGATREDDVLVRRFPVDAWDPAARAGLEAKLGVAGRLSPAEQEEWLASGPRSAALMAHVARSAAACDAVVALPYLMSIPYFAAWAAPERVLLWPCLHDEPYAYLEPIRLLMETVRGVLFNAPEEAALATGRLGMRLPRHAVLGAGVTVAAAPGDEQRRPSRGAPPLLYIGRLEAGKNLSLLYDFARRYHAARPDFRLHLVGKGPFRPPDRPPFVNRGFLSESDKAAACAAALALCQPSLNESFSLTAMECWLAGRPVLAHMDSPVVRGHVDRSRGGLYFRTYDEFAGALEWFRTEPALAARMGANGRRYVQANYTWAAVINRFERAVAAWPVVART